MSRHVWFVAIILFPVGMIGTTQVFGQEPVRKSVISNDPSAGEQGDRHGAGGERKDRPPIGQAHGAERLLDEPPGRGRENDREEQQPDPLRLGRLGDEV